MSEEHAHAGTGGQHIRPPFPGSRPFGPSDARVFFGRTAQTRQLQSLWLAQPVVVLTGPPAVGKTSLLHAGVLPALTEADVADALPVGRITPDPGVSGTNRVWPGRRPGPGVRPDAAPELGRRRRASAARDDGP